MSNSLLTDALRWVLAVPGGVVAAALVAFPIHWLIMVNLGGWAREPLIEIQDPATLRQIELVLQSVFGPFVFLFVAACIVPKYNRSVCVLLAVAVVLGVPLVVYWRNAEVIARGHGIVIEQGLVQFFANVIGSGAAIWMIWGCGRMTSEKAAEKQE